MAGAAARAEDARARVASKTQQRVLAAAEPRVTRKVSACFKAAVVSMGPLPPETKEAAPRLPVNFSQPNWDAFERSMTRLLTQEYVNLGNEGIDAASQMLGVAIDFSLNERNIDRLDIANRVKGISKDSQEVLRNIITRGIDDGLHPNTIAKQMRETMLGWAELTKSRSVTIARTETANAYNLGAIRGYREAGFVKKVRVIDAPTCGWHGHDDPDLANGKIVTLDVAGRNPISHPNCVRAFAPVAITQADLNPEPSKAPTGADMTQRFKDSGLFTDDATGFFEHMTLDERQAILAEWERLKGLGFRQKITGTTQLRVGPPGYTIKGNIGLRTRIAWGQTPQGSIESVFRHEYMHVISHGMTAADRDALIERLLKEIGATSYRDRIVGDLLGSYATRSPEEFLAEYGRWLYGPKPKDLPGADIFKAALRRAGALEEDAASAAARAAAEAAAKAEAERVAAAEAARAKAEAEAAAKKADLTFKPASDLANELDADFSDLGLRTRFDTLDKVDEVLAQLKREKALLDEQADRITRAWIASGESNLRRDATLSADALRQRLAADKVQRVIDRLERIRVDLTPVANLTAEGIAAGGDLSRLTVEERRRLFAQFRTDLTALDKEIARKEKEFSDVFRTLYNSTFEERAAARAAIRAEVEALRKQKATLQAALNRLSTTLPLEERVAALRPTRKGAPQTAFDTALGAAKGIEAETGLSNRWSGVVNIGGAGRGAAASYGWDNAMQVSRTTLTYTETNYQKVILHEMYHGASVGVDPAAYRTFPGWEEGVVERATQVYEQGVRSHAGWQPGTGYNTYHAYTKPLEELRTMLASVSSDERFTEKGFYRLLLSTPLKDRQTLVEGLVLDHAPAEIHRARTLFDALRRRSR